MSSLDTPSAPEATPTTNDLPLAPPSGYTGNQKILVLLAAFLGWMFDGLEMGIFPQIARSALGELLAKGATEDTIKWWHQIIDACFLFGAALGGLVFGWLGDRIGRVKAMAFSILVYSGFTGLLYFVRAPEHIAILRFIAAIGMGGEWALGVALVMEVWDAKYRPLLAGMIGAAANVGFLIVGIIGATIKIDQHNWRLLALVGAAPALLTFIIRMFVPESHAWTAAQTKKPTRPLTELFGDKRLARSALLAIVFASITLLGTWGAVQKIPAWVGGMPSVVEAKAAQAAALASPDTAPPVPHRSILTDPARAQGTSQMALAIGAIVGCMIAPLVAAWLNRRITFFLLCLGSLVSCLLLFRTFTDYSLSFLALVFVVGGMTAAVYGWLPLYLPELFPTRVRATAQGISFNFGRIFAGIGGIVLGGAVPGGYAKMGAVVSLIYVVGMLVIWLAPETKGKPLPE
jgi:SHS family sialic acid transporter-like MFS transporter